MDEQQWVVVCLSSEDYTRPPDVYAAWPSAEEAAAWLDTQHMSDKDEENEDMCAVGGYEEDHFVVPAQDTE